MGRYVVYRAITVIPAEAVDRNPAASRLYHVLNTGFRWCEECSRATNQQLTNCQKTSIP